MGQTTLILGAGLGREYGFPDGPQLRLEIADRLTNSDQELRSIVRWSPAETVDELAFRHPRYADRLRELTALILVERELNSVDLLSQSARPNTYKLILKQILQARERGDDVQIITFNYDRSLAYLIFNHDSIQDRPDDRIGYDRVAHVYGRIAPLEFEGIHIRRDVGLANTEKSLYSIQQ